MVLALGAMLVSTAAIAGAAIGVTASYTDISANGNEKLKTSGSTTTHSASEEVIVPSIWFEVTSEESGLTIGLDFIPHTAEVGSGANSGDDDLETSGTNKVSVDFKNHMTVYVEKTLGSWLYIKGGYSHVTLNTNDTVSTGAKYGNEDINATRIGVGIKRDIGESGLVKLELESADYDGATFESTGSDGVTTVTLEELDTTALRISFGKKF